MAKNRIQQLQRVNPVLTAIAQGYSNNAFIADLILPVVDVEKEVGEIPTWGKGNFLVAKTERGLRAKSNRIDAGEYDTIPYQLTEYDAEMSYDYREEIAATEINLKAEATETTMNVIQLNAEKAAADILQNTATYPVGHSETLASGNEFSDPDSDPVAIIREAKEVVEGSTAKQANVLMLSPDSYSALRSHPKLIELIKYAQVGILTDDLLKTIFDVDEIIVGRGVYTNDAGDFVPVWSDTALVLYVPRSSTQSERNPALGYTLRLKGNPVTDDYEENGGKIKVVRSTSIHKHMIVGAQAGYLIKNTVA